jgi:lipoyl(octanoyl) transferase
MPALIEHWGPVPYAAALERQLAYWRRRVESSLGDVIVSVEHPPTITLGRHASEDDVLVSAAELVRRGVEVVRSDRGGRATVHGPGQVVVYPIVGIAQLGVGVRRWVCDLEGALLATLDSYGIVGRRVCGQPGIWTEAGKIASIGLRVARGVSYHGVALYVDLDTGPFDCIVACGVAAERITSIARERSDPPSRDAVAERLCRAIAATVDSYERRSTDTTQTIGTDL